MAEWLLVCRVRDVPPGAQRFVRAGGLELAVFHLAEADEFVVIPNGCPHAGGNLSAGMVCGAVVTCPWHQWEFDLKTGRCVHNEQVQVRRYPVRTTDDGWIAIQAQAADEPAAP